MVVASYPERTFQLWDYTVSHGMLLVRAPRGPGLDRNVDLVFTGVSYIAVPRLMRGLELERANETDLASMRNQVHITADEDVFALVSQGRRHHVVAIDCSVRENEDDLFDSSWRAER